MPRPDEINPVLVAGVAVVAAAGALWLVLRRPRVRAGGVQISQAQASRFAFSWAQSHAEANGLTLISQTRNVFFVGKPPRMTSADWQAVGGTPTRAFFYVEFSYVGDNFLTVMIDAVTGEKPPVSEGWVADTISRAFGL